MKSSTAAIITQYITPREASLHPESNETTSLLRLLLHAENSRDADSTSARNFVILNILPRNRFFRSFETLGGTSANTALWSWGRAESQKSKDIASLHDYMKASQQATVIQPSSKLLNS